MGVFEDFFGFSDQFRTLTCQVVGLTGIFGKVVDFDLFFDAVVSYSTFPGHLVKARGFDQFLTVNAKVALCDIVAGNKNEVGLFHRGSECGERKKRE